MAPSEQRPQLQRLAWAQDGSLLSLLSSVGVLSLFAGDDLAELGTFDLRSICPDFAHGSAGLFLRKTKRPGGKTYEAVVASFSGKIYRVLIPMDSDDPVCPLTDSVRASRAPLISWKLTFRVLSG